MAVLRSDIIVPEVFTPYVIEQTTARDSFLASGVVAPMAELNATEGGDFVNVCLLYTSPSPRDLSTSRMPSSA